MLYCLTGLLGATYVVPSIIEYSKLKKIRENTEKECIHILKSTPGIVFNDANAKAIYETFEKASGLAYKDVMTDCFIPFANLVSLPKFISKKMENKYAKINDKNEFDYRYAMYKLEKNKLVTKTENILEDMYSYDSLDNLLDLDEYECRIANGESVYEMNEKPKTLGSKKMNHNRRIS